MKTTLILVGADKGGVGKTTISRVLLDYLHENEINTRAFDTEAPGGTLQRFYGDITEVVNMSHTSDQMRIIDTLEEQPDTVSVVDVRAGQLRTILETLLEVGFLDAAAEGEFNFMLFHILGSSIASLDEISETAPFAADAHYYLVKNYVAEGSYFEWDPGTYRSYFNQVKSATEVTVPKLNDLAYEQVDLAGVPFTSFIDDRANSFVLRGYVRSWLDRAFAEFEEAGVLSAVGTKSTRRRTKAK